MAVVLLGTDSNINCICNTIGGPCSEFCSVLLIKCEQTVSESVCGSCCTCSLTCHGFDHVEPVFSPFNVKGVDDTVLPVLALLLRQ